jgi:L-ascorbate metabolism protein UlaG (beta-lactamase superfamily)
MSRQAGFLLLICIPVAASAFADVGAVASMALVTPVGRAPSTSSCLMADGAGSSSVASMRLLGGEGKGDEPKSGIHVRSLGGNSWALKIDAKMLIFDYVGGVVAPEGGSREVRNLQAGYVDPRELAGLDVYVFVTHSHQDHFDPVILEWQGQAQSLRYFFGWQAGADSVYHCMVEPHAHEQCGAVEVWTINSRSDVPEVAYLVKVDGITIYHNGDYRGSYVEDFKYLRSIADHIDIAFVIGWPYPAHQQFRQATLLAEIFGPMYMFAMCREGNEDKSRQFAELLAQRSVSATVLYAKHRGAEFLCSRRAAD